MSRSSGKPDRNSIVPPTPTSNHTPAPSAKPTTLKELKPEPAAVQKRAHEIYLARITKSVQGTPESDWLQAERELSSK